MKKIKINFESWNKHIFLGFSFVIFSLISSVYWGLTYAADVVLDPNSIPPTTTIPVSPTGLSIGNVTLSSVGLTWIDNSDNEDKFNINRKVSGTTTWIPLTLVTGSNITSYIDTTVTSGTTYDYQVEACLSGTGCSTPVEYIGVFVPSTTSVVPNNNSASWSYTSPLMPTNLRQSTTVVANAISLIWTNGSTSQDSFKIQRKINSTTSTTWTDLIFLTGGTLSSYIDYSVTSGIFYDYRIQSCLVNTCSGYVVLERVYVPTTTVSNPNTTTAPIIPANLATYTTLTSTMSTIPLKWTDNSTNEISFVVEKKLSTAVAYTLIYTTGSNITTYVDSAVTAGVSYDYRVKACSSTTLCSDYVYLSGVIIPVTTVVSSSLVAPNNPVNLVLYGTLTATSKSIIIKWTDSSTTEDKFVIERKASSDTTYTYIGQVLNTTRVVTATANSTTGTSYYSDIVSYTDSTNIVAGTKYDYRVKSCVGDICSPGIELKSLFIPVLDTNTVPAVVNPMPVSQSVTQVIPSAPSNLHLYGNLALTAASKFINLQWVDTATNEDKFNIERRLSTTTVWNYLNQIIGSNITSYTDNTAVPGTSYDYRVQACLSNVGCSAYVVLEKVLIPLAVTTLTPVVPLTVVTTPVVEKTVTTAPVVETVKTVPMPVTTTKINTTALPVVETKTTTVPTETISNIDTSLNSLVDNKIGLSTETSKEVIQNLTDVLNIAPQIQESTDLQVVKNDTLKQETINLVYKDTNNDGISDYDSKYIYNIDPIKPSIVSSYEGKTVNAGEKILLGFDPSKKELEKVVSEEPLQSKSDIVVSSYKVNNIKLTDDKKIEIKGQALPNSFITLYIYSTPIMVTVKTDSNGEWHYILDKELENGNHTVYTATVNNSGNIVAKSTPFTFTKTAEAVSLNDLPVRESANAIQKPGLLEGRNLYVVIIGLFMVVGITLIFIGLFTRKSSQI